MIKTTFLLLTATFCLAQSPERARAKPQYYQFEFAVKELDANKTVVSTKNYSAMGTDQVAIRSGDKISTSGGRGAETTFVDVGTNIDCRVFNESSTELGLMITADISSGGTERPLVVSQVKWSSRVVVPLKKPTVVYSSAGASRKVQTQLEVTITPLP